MSDSAGKQVNSALHAEGLDGEKTLQTAENKEGEREVGTSWGIDVRRAENVWQAKVLGVFVLAGTLIGAATSPQLNEEAPRLMGALWGCFSGLVIGWFVSGWYLMVYRSRRPDQTQKLASRPNRSPAKIVLWGIVESVCLVVAVGLGVIWETGLKSVDQILVRDDVWALWAILGCCFVLVVCRVGLELVYHYRNRVH